ncbi:peptidoglycan DD-metalloendopeptidase family protein [Pelomonas aquatica]|jgi:lipoprotein NlpD|uniref:LysM peptidoglycan-binding domain-containing protein n=1 Tax=Pelomonas aquatica TaxID=431058 RepID=A0A9X4LEV8_9BURK|nr:peptidoglycan DD-metalloendopeptidase family protein [Pelomonas aquatica]MCY4754827.1 peptidoglycan DD-metalloendopeptidase family protein [Pelomonas aquatica]MDG0861859.1 LysM peptidoglycan-binding domain-containing protein [Pelomonas aquatica]
MPSSLRFLLALSTSLLLSACGTSLHRAPVEDRNPQQPRPAAEAASSAASAPEAKLPPGAENAGKPGYYTVKPGDALIRIALDNGQSWRDVAKWNSLENPNRIEVGQVLRVVPPGVDAAAVTARPIASAPKVEARPLDAKPPVAVASVPPAAASAAPAAPAAEEDGLAWGWPVAQPVSAGFDEQRNKGLDFSGKPGDPVLAVADGRVVYAGSGLRGYGNLVIIKHNNTYLTAYAHNRAMLVEQDQVVRKGQRIAEMGSTESDTVKLHFEVRKLGKPVDPARLLPPR